MTTQLFDALRYLLGEERVDGIEFLVADPEPAWDDGESWCAVILPDG